MENQPVTASPTVQTTTPPVPAQKPANRLVAGLLILAIALLAAGYGAYAYLNGSWPFAPGQPTASDSPVAQVPADWKSYSNSSMAFSVKYPPTWTIREEGPTGKFVHITPPGSPTDGTGFDVSLNLVARDAETLYREDLATCTKDGSVLASGPVTVGGVPGWRLGCTSSYGSDYQNNYLPIDNGKTLVVSHGFDVAAHLQVVSTLRVLSLTAGWKTYASKPHGFEVRYPSNVELRIVENNYEFMLSDPGKPNAPYFFAGITLLTRQQFITPNHPNGTVLGETADYVAVRQDSQGCLSAEFCAENAVLATRILGTFRFTSDAAAAWSDFSAKYFTLSFMVPAAVMVIEDQNNINISVGQPRISDIGGTNSFFRLSRYGGSSTKASEIALKRQHLKNITESQVVIDGAYFLVIRGDDDGRYEGDSAGRVTAVFFDASWLEIVEKPAVDSNPIKLDLVSLGEQILATFHLRK